MGIQKNMAKVIRVLKEQRRQSLTEFSEDLEISRSTLQEYLNGTGNPRADTIDHLAAKLNVDPAVLVSGKFEETNVPRTLALLDTFEIISTLPMDKRKIFADLFMQMLSLWTE